MLAVCGLIFEDKKLTTKSIKFLHILYINGIPLSWHCIKMNMANVWRWLMRGLDFKASLNKPCHDKIMHCKNEYCTLIPSSPI